jgi:metal-dependent amidase/aminoacylase/carboxypeptidase family protein
MQDKTVTITATLLPDLAQIELVARNPSMLALNEIWARILKVAQGATMMTETTGRH